MYLNVIFFQQKSARNKLLFVDNRPIHTGIKSDPQTDQVKTPKTTLNKKPTTYDDQGTI